MTDQYDQTPGTTSTPSPNTPRDWTSFDPKTKLTRVIECSKRYARSHDIYCIAKTDLLLIKPEVLTEDVVCVVPYKHRYDLTVAYYASKQDMILSAGGHKYAQRFCQAIDDREFKKAFYLIHVLDDKAFVRECGPRGDTLVQYCITDGGQLLFEAVLRKVSTDAVLTDGYTTVGKTRTNANILHTITSYGNTEFLRILIAIRPDLVSELANESDSHDMLPLRYAANTSNGELAEILFGYIDKDKIEPFVVRYKSILDKAITKKNHRLVESSISDKLIPTEKKKLEAIYLAAKASNYKTFKAIYNAHTLKGLLGQEHCNNSTILHHMIIGKNGQTACQFIREHGADIDLLTAIDYDDRRPLQLAACKGLGDVCELLYDTYASRGLLLEPIEKDGSTFFHKLVASECNKLVSGEYDQTIKRLTTRPDFDRKLLTAVDDHGLSALQWAAICGLHDTYILLRDLCTKNDCIPTDDEYRCTTFSMVAICGHANVVSLLLKEYANTELLGMQYIEGRTALHLAASKGRSDVCRILYDHMSSEQLCLARPSNGTTALHMAVIKEREDIVEILLQDPIKSRDLVNITDINGDTALQLATEYYPEMLETLTKVLQAFEQ